ncbi:MULTISPECIES: Bro-N domain-containing protein [Acinetobacter]|uniref:BRO-N domain-containing protein n=1 Tax=Acinetobacter TaxID=469 RepID=UPI000C4B78FC|nr:MULTISPECIES: Bro-N domain-containing protein [unclassified Acinetobacter]MBC69732.1 phage antirepressor protein [Acinetobacter sp.]
MNAISNFTFHNDYNVRIIDINGEFWFVATDVANALDYRDAGNMVRNLDDDERGTHNMSTPSGDQNLSIINESGLYSAILKSRKPEAKKFKKWVTSEVLPAIRKTGKYEAPKPIEKRDYINNSDMLNIKRLIWACTHHISHGEAFKFGIWHSLRKVTGVPSPAKFEVQHLPILAQEFQRILNIVEPYFEARRECELALIKRVIRERGDHQVVKALLDEMKASTTDFNETLQKHLPMVFDQDCLNLLNRRPNGYDHSDCNERSI